MLTARVLVILMSLVLVACSHFQNTPAQDLALERWEKCQSAAPGVSLQHVRPDGQISYTYSGPSGLPAVQNCLREAAIEQGKRRGTAPPAVAIAAPATPALRPSSAATITPDSPAIKSPPVWKIGDEWVYRYDQPSGAGTFVWTVDRIEPLRGEPHYVIKSGTRQIFYRVSDVAFSEERLDGEVVRILNPSEPRLAFPLTVGKSWDMTYEETRPVARQTDHIQRSYEMQAHEQITVAAGTFSAMRIVCNNKRNGAWVMTLWFADEPRQYVRMEWPLTGGRHTRELLSYRIR